jgi:hypothetical protein
MRFHSVFPGSDEPLDPPVCGVCGLPLTGDADDRPDHPAGPLCGPCHRAREFDQTLWELDLRDGEEPW